MRQSGRQVRRLTKGFACYQPLQSPVRKAPENKVRQARLETSGNPGIHCAGTLRKSPGMREPVREIGTVETPFRNYPGPSLIKDDRVPCAAYPDKSASAVHPPDPAPTARNDPVIGSPLGKR